MTQIGVATQNHLGSGATSGNGLLDDVVKAIEKVIYVVFIHPILWFLSQVSTVIFFIGSGSISKKLFNGNDTLAGLPIEYIVALGIAIGLVGILLGIKLIMIMTEKYQEKGKVYRKTIQNFCFAVITIVLIPIIFFLINNLINWITTFINQKTESNSNDLGLFIFNASFDNGQHHFTYVPDAWNFDDSNHFNYIICLFSECFMIYLLILITLNLFTRIFELFLLYCVSPIVIVATVSDNDGSQKYFRNWLELTLQKFLLFTFIFLAFNTFLTTINLFTQIATAIPTETTRPVFVLLGVFGAGLVVVKAPQILNAVVGGQASLIDSFGQISALATATRGAFGVGLLGGKVATKVGRYSKDKALGVRTINDAGETIREGGIIAHAGRFSGTVSHPIKTAKNVGSKIKSSSNSFSQEMKDHFKKHFDQAVGKSKNDK